MLCLARRINESVFIGDIEVKIVDLGRGLVRLGITAPSDIPIDRAEVRERKRRIMREDGFLPPRPIELCCLCDCATGKAGRSDGSLYCLCGCGPFCEDCFYREPCPNCNRMTKCDD